MVCGLKGSKRCSNCLLAFYCSKEHQVQHWPSHKATCTHDTSEVCAIKYAFPELEIVLEAEPDKHISVCQPRVESEMESLVSDMNLNEESDNEKEAVDTAIHVDRAFMKFQKRISREPQQVLRYNNKASTDSELWVNADSRPVVDKCGKCQPSDRILGFQIMPQLICRLGCDIDFGSIFVYTCPKLCGGEYTREFMWKQEFTDDGMRNPKDC